jgi:hypothetical protein
MGSAKNSNAELVNLIIEDETAKLEEEEALHLLYIRPEDGR